MDDTIKILISTIISVISLIISLLSLKIHVKTQKIQKLSYYLNRDEQFGSNVVVKLVSTQQVDDKVSIKLVIYNLDSKPVLIQSLSVYKKEKSQSLFKRLLNIEDYVNIPSSYWWPKYKSESVETKSFSDEYENILIKDLMDFQVVFPGQIDDVVYHFVLKTNKGCVTHSTPIRINGCYFSHAYYQKRSYEL